MSARLSPNQGLSNHTILTQFIISRPSPFKEVCGAMYCFRPDLSQHLQSCHETFPLSMEVHSLKKDQQRSVNSPTGDGGLTDTWTFSGGGGGGGAFYAHPTPQEAVLRHFSVRNWQVPNVSCPSLYIGL
jgi:hypothetical protein